MQKSIVTSDNTKINYDIIQGKTPYIVFVHGIGGDLSAWRFIIDPLRKMNISMLAIDLRGHGLSGRPEKFGSYKIDLLAMDILEVIKNEKIKEFMIAGHSFGGIVTIKFHELYPNEAAGYILINTPHVMRNFGFIKIFNNNSFANLLNRLLEKIPAKKKCKHRYQKLGTGKDISLIELGIDVKYSGFKSLTLAWIELFRYNGLEAMKTIKQPTKVIVSLKDTVHPIGIADKIKELIPHVEYDVIDESDHNSVINHPENVMNEMLSFLKIQNYL